MLAFWRNGYRETSLDDLVDATGASRASLYQVFGDKRDLFLQCLTLYGDRFSERVDAVLRSSLTGKEAIALLLNASADRLCSSEAPPGCLRCHSTLALGGSDKAIDEALLASNRAFERNIRRVVDKSVKAGELAKAQAKHLPLYYTTIVNGLVTLARSGASRQQLAEVISIALDAWHDDHNP